MWFLEEALRVPLLGEPPFARPPLQAHHRAKRPGGLLKSDGLRQLDLQRRRGKYRAVHCLVVVVVEYRTIGVFFPAKKKTVSPFFFSTKRSTCTQNQSKILVFAPRKKTSQFPHASKVWPNPGTEYLTNPGGGGDLPAEKKKQSVPAGQLFGTT